ncbi:ashwin isoform 1-T1 [Lycodopsis pacificus]
MATSTGKDGKAVCSSGVDLLLHPELLSHEFMQLILREKHVSTRECESRDRLTELYLRHVIPLPQRTLPDSRWGKRMEKIRGRHTAAGHRSDSKSKETRTNHLVNGNHRQVKTSSCCKPVQPRPEAVWRHVFRFLFLIHSLQHRHSRPQTGSKRLGCNEVSRFEEKDPPCDVALTSNLYTHGPDCSLGSEGQTAPLPPNVVSQYLCSPHPSYPTKCTTEWMKPLKPVCLRHLTALCLPRADGMVLRGSCF